MNISSPNAGKRAGRGNKNAKKKRLGYVELNPSLGSGKKPYVEQVGQLERQISVAKIRAKKATRLKLVRLNLAHDLAAEALGILREMLREEPAIRNELQFNIHRGVANVLMRRPKDAHKDLKLYSLSNDPDASLWRGLLGTYQGKWKKALDEFRAGRDVISSYPLKFQGKFRLAAARAALEQSKLKEVADHLEALPEKGMTLSQNAEASLLRGWYLEEIGKTSEALEAFDDATGKDIRPVSAEALLRRTGLLVKIGKTKKPEAIEALERLQMIWRGDDLELKTLEQLAKYYVGEERFRDAFKIMKEAVQAHPRSQRALGLQDKMKGYFNDLFLYGGSASMQPVEALGLYYDFKELTPVGRLGDELIRRLADRLVSVDLLEQSAQLLDYQIKKRLKGAARAQVAVRLAMVYLLNRKPELSLRALRQTRQARLPELLRQSRNLLEARALGELGRARSALEVLAPLHTPEADRIRADALWKAKIWPEAGEQFEKLLGASWQKLDPFSTQQRVDVLRAAISYTFADDKFALDRLRQKFLGKMVNSPEGRAFTAISEPVKANLSEFSKIAREVAAIDTLEAFITAFRARFDAPSTPTLTNALIDSRS